MRVVERLLRGIDLSPPRYRPLRARPEPRRSCARHRLGAIGTAAEAERLAARADPQQRLYLVPGFAGLGAPYWAPRARGALIGLTAECGLPEIARATLEAVGYQTRDLVEAMTADSGVAVASLRSMAAWR